MRILAALVAGDEAVLEARRRAEHAAARTLVAEWRSKLQREAPAAAAAPLPRKSSIVGAHRQEWRPSDSAALGDWPSLMYDERAAARRHQAASLLRDAAAPRAGRPMTAASIDQSLWASSRHEGAPIAGRPSRYATTMALGAGRACVSEQIDKRQWRRLPDYLRAAGTLQRPPPRHYDEAAAAARAAADVWARMAR